MTTPWISKAVLGGSVFAGTSMGAGSVLLTPSKYTHTKSTSKKGCRIHKLNSSDRGEFEKIEQEELEQEILGLRQGNFFKQIQEVCVKVGNKDIFISNKNSTGWKYYEEDQNDQNLKGKFEAYLKKNSLSS
ncbi:hypothetical protein MHC_01990 [Mycoplasma haemocanis str. Illinois]|uniref:Uncharacterized protein n=1 Tax=Mycoplasma haemocanis (strain Illinois) TaxID=1111676 RepID=H6N6J2_MYCHN|nr:hypothetical protein [Mycoplasma haemocanis]AEW45264.1 hypothetical protein MHC_01990 [Mycoplasma haemocanis str. Illinois]